MTRYIGSQVKMFDKQLLGVKLPDIFARTPRSITERKFWKGYLVLLLILCYTLSCMYNV